MFPNSCARSQEGAPEEAKRFDSYIEREYEANIFNAVHNNKLPT